MTKDAPGNQVGYVLRVAAQTIADAGCDTPRLDAEVLLAHVLNCDRAWLYAHPEHSLSSTHLSVYQSLVTRRARREPVAYLTGHKEFFGLDFSVTPDVLIPRPETERLIEVALQLGRAGTSAALTCIADVGTGSGAIAVTLAVHLPQAQVIAIDISAAALAVARSNAARHGVAERVRFLQSDLLTSLVGPIQLIVSNPPYLRQAELTAAPPEVANWEPRTGLNGGPDGLDIIRRLLAMASTRLGSGGVLLIEIGASQGIAVVRLARRHLPQATAEILQDHAGRDRLLLVRR